VPQKRRDTHSQRRVKERGSQKMPKNRENSQTVREKNRPKGKEKFQYSKASDNLLYKGEGRKRKQMEKGNLGGG